MNLLALKIKELYTPVLCMHRALGRQCFTPAYKGDLWSSGEEKPVIQNHEEKAFGKALG